MEIWKDVVGYEELFKISNYGNFYSKRNERQYKLHTNKKGYVTCGVSLGDRSNKKHLEYTF